MPAASIVPNERGIKALPCARRGPPGAGIRGKSVRHEDKQRAERRTAAIRFINFSAKKEVLKPWFQAAFCLLCPRRQSGQSAAKGKTLSIGFSLWNPFPLTTKGRASALPCGIPPGRGEFRAPARSDFSFARKVTKSAPKGKPFRSGFPFGIPFL